MFMCDGMSKLVFKLHYYTLLLALLSVTILLLIFYATYSNNKRHLHVQEKKIFIVDNYLQIKKIHAQASLK